MSPTKGAEILDLDATEITPGPTAMDTIARGELDVQILTAKRFPRSIKAFKDHALELATLDEETAGSCLYSLPREGKTIDGPSARLAEVCIGPYGNLRVEARIVDDDGRFLTARGTAFDIQHNVLIAVEVRRRVTGKNGRRFSDDMITVTANAAISIALRNVVFKIIPKAYWWPIYEACRQVAVGNASTLAKRRDVMLAYFQKLGVLPARVFLLLGVTGAEDITLEHLATLKGLATAIKEGDTTVDQAFETPGRDPKPTDKPKPTGFDDWLIDLQEVADAGGSFLAEAWKRAPQATREYLTATEPGALDALKARAVMADAAKAKGEQGE